MERTVERFAPLAGIAFAVLLVASVAGQGSSPVVGDPVSDVTDFYGDNSAQIRVAVFLAALSAFTLLIFAAHLSTAMRRKSDHAILPITAVGGAVIAAGGMAVDAATRFTLVESVGEISPDALEAVFALWSKSFLAVHIGFAILIVATSLSVLDSKLLPAWAAGLGIVAGALLIVPVEAVTLAGLVLAALWVVATGVLLFRQPVAAT